MKKSIALFWFMLALAVVNQVSAQIPSDGLVGYWPFTGNANDASGNGNNGTVNGATLTTDRFGNANSAYDFSNGYVSTSSSVFNTNQFTISCWVKPNYLGDNMGSIGGNYTVNQGGFFMGLTDGFAHLRIHQTSNNIQATASQAVAVDIWSHIVFVCGPQDLLIYVNGVLEGSTSLSGFPFVNNSNFNIGRAPWVLYEQVASFHGPIDDVGFYNRALTPAEISQLYTDQTSLVEEPCVPFLGEDQTVCAGTSVTLNAGSSSLACPTLPSNLQTGLVGYWPFCGNANDASGNGNNGTVNGATLTTDRFGNANSAYAFDGVSDFISAYAFNLPQGNDNRTFNCWINFQTSIQPSPFNDWNSVLCYGNFSSYCGGNYLIVNNDESINYAGASGECGGIVSQPQNLFGDWHQLSLTYSNGMAELYVDGNFVDQVQSVNLNTTGNQLFIGKFVNSNLISQLYYFHGDIDDVNIYNRALSASEIQQLFTLGQSTYLWSTGATTSSINVTPTTTTTYTCTVTDANGNACTDSVTVYVPEITSTDLNICAGESTTLSVSGINTAAVPSTCPTLPSNLQNGLVGYWPFCGNANDASGNGNNGTVNGATLTADRFGNANGAYSFDGVSSKINLSQAINFSNSSFTVSLFCKASDFGNSQIEGYSYIFGSPLTGGTNDQGFRFASYSNLNTYSATIGDQSINDYIIIGASGLNFDWYNLTMVFDRQNATFSFYVNNIIAGSLPVSPNFGNTDSGILPTIGTFQLNNWNQHYFNGQIDDIAIYNRALTASEIQQLYTLGQTSYEWSTGDTTSTIDVAPTETTTYICTITSNGVTCTDSITVNIQQPLLYYADTDNDGFGAGNATSSCVDLGAGYVSNNTDCDDTNASINTAASEICNDLDDNCNSLIDDGLAFTNYYSDADNDGFGAGNAASSCVDLGAGYVLDNTDCDDSNASINTAANEICNDIDDNCNSLIDDGLTFTNYYADADNDGFGAGNATSSCVDLGAGYVLDNTDCDDTNASVNPAAEDIASNGIDENCDGQIDNSIFELNTAISLFPNPSRSELNIQVNSSIIGNDLYIFDAVGKLVYKQQLLTTQTTLNVSNFADGNYLVRIGEVMKRFEVIK